MRKLQVASAVIVMLVTSFPLSRAIYLYATLQPKRLATLAELNDEIRITNGADWPYKSLVASQLQAGVDRLSAPLIPPIQSPFAYLAYVSPPSPYQPDDPPCLIVRWFESGFDVDGIDFYVDGELRKSLRGWSKTYTRDQAELWEDRCDRFYFIDLPVVDSETPDRSTDLIRLTRADLEAKLELQLWVDEPQGPRMAIPVTNAVKSRYATIPK